VEFGLEATVRSGKLTGLLVEGGGAAALKITLTWKSETQAVGGDSSAPHSAGPHSSDPDGAGPAAPSSPAPPPGRSDPAHEAAQEAGGA
jgi:hypothetical protein